MVQPYKLTHSHHYAIVCTLVEATVTLGNFAQGTHEVFTDGSVIFLPVACVDWTLEMNIVSNTWCACKHCTVV